MNDYLKQAEEKLNNNEFDEAIELCNKQIETGEKLDDAYYLRARVRYYRVIKGESDAVILDAALNDVNKFIDYNPCSHVAHYFAAILSEYLTNYEDAIIFINKSLELCSDDADYYVKRADISAKLGRIKEAIADYSNAISIKPNSDNYIYRGDFYKSIEDYQSAKSDYITAITLDSNNAEGHINLGDVYTELDMYEDAIVCYNKGISIDDFSEYYYKRGFVKKQLRRYKEALLDYSLAIEKNPNNSFFYLERGALILEIPSQDDVNQGLTQSLELHQEYAQYKKTKTKNIKEKYYKAIKDYKKALECDENSVDAYLALIDAYQKVGENTECLNLFEKVISINPDDASLYYAKAELEYYLQSYETAIIDYTKCLEINPDLLNVYTKLGLCKKALHKDEEAIKDFDKALDFEFEKYKAFYYKAGSCKNLGLIDDAIDCYKKSIECKNDFIDAYIQLGQIYLKSGYSNEAWETFNKVLELNPNAIDALIQRALLNRTLKKYDNALIDFNKVLEIKPDFAKIYTLRAVVEFDLEQYEEALADYEKALELGENDSTLYLGLGETNIKFERYEEAINYLEKAIELDPEDDESYYNLGEAKYHLEDYEGAIEALNVAIDISSEPDPGYYVKRASAKENLGLYKEAQKDMELACRIDAKANKTPISYVVNLDESEQLSEKIESTTEKANNFNDIGNNLYNEGKYEEAEANYTNAIELNPEFAEAYYNRGDAKYRLEQYEESINDYNAAITLYPEYVSAYHSRGWSYYALKNYQAALDDWNKVLKTDANYDLNNLMKAYCEDELGLYEEAINSLTIHINKNPESSNAYFNRALAKENINDIEGAIEDYKMANKLNPDDVSTQNCLNRLLDDN